VTRVYEVIGPTLEQAGVEHVFGVLGDGNMRFVSQFGVTCAVRFHGARHEATGVAMADGYARTTGRVGVTSMTEGPGVANALIGLRAAAMARTPLVALAGAPPAGAKGHIQEIDQDGVFALAGAAVAPVPAPDDVAAALLEALDRANAERRPVGLSLPIDLQVSECSDRSPAHPPPAATDVPATEAGDIARAVELIASARRPVVIGGRGAVLSSARESLAALAEVIGAPLATSLLGKDLFAGHPRSIGIAGGFSSEPAAELLGKADLILAFGAGLNLWTTRGGTLFGPSARIVQCDIEPAALGFHRTIDVGIAGDAAQVAERLREALQAPSASEWTDDDLGLARAGFEFTDLSTDEELDPRTLFIALDELLPANRTLAHDGGHYLGFPVKHIAVPEPTAYLFGAHFGAVGLGMGAAMGAAIGRPDRLTVGCVGDGGILMTLGEIETAVRLRLPVLIVIVNDGAYGAELHHLNLLGLPAEQSLFGDVDVAAAAAGLGAQAATVRTTADLSVLEPWLERPEGPFVLDCKITTAVCDRWMEDVAAADAGAMPVRH
jgi:thiamine pyrophosphate-dependent acetolactate synthase large subunit-like protein